jgi:hypothetical protein
LVRCKPFRNCHEVGTLDNNFALWCFKHQHETVVNLRCHWALLLKSISISWKGTFLAAKARKGRGCGCRNCALFNYGLCIDPVFND